MSDQKSVRFRQEQMSVFNGNNCPLSAGFSVRNHRNMQFIPYRRHCRPHPYYNTFASKPGKCFEMPNFSYT